MTKSEFILSLSEALAQLPGHARSRALEYFEEMIDDRVEGGMSEEEAVAALGSIDDILKEVAPEALNTSHHSDETTSDPDEKFIILHEPIKTLTANSACADLTVRSEALPDGITARIDYNLSKEAKCICTLEDGQLSVQYKKDVQRRFTFRNFFDNLHESITITLNDPALAGGRIQASSGDVELSKLVFTDSLDVGTASGDLKARDLAVQNNCKLHTASGDMTAQNLTCGELLELHTVSGDMDLWTVRAGRISAGTASGEPTLGSIECDELHVESASGDIEVRDVRSGKIFTGTASGDQTLLNSDCSGNIEMSTASGDIEIRDARCTGSIDLNSTSGDIRGELLPKENYRFSARSRTGDVNVPRTDGPCLVEIHTTSGDIDF